MSETRNFVVVQPGGTEGGIFTGRNPRQAALKAANRGNGTKEKPETITLRERGTKKLHIFKGYKQQVKSPEKRPAWVPETVNKPFVEKQGTENPDKKKAAKSKKGKGKAKPK